MNQAMFPYAKTTEQWITGNTILSGPTAHKEPYLYPGIADHPLRPAYTYCREALSDEDLRKVEQIFIAALLKSVCAKSDPAIITLGSILSESPQEIPYEPTAADFVFERLRSFIRFTDLPGSRPGLINRLPPHPTHCFRIFASMQGGLGTRHLFRALRDLSWIERNTLAVWLLKDEYVNLFDLEAIRATIKEDSFVGDLANQMLARQLASL